jgi:hypothetical protein
MRSISRTIKQRRRPGLPSPSRVDRAGAARSSLKVGTATCSSGSARVRRAQVKPDREDQGGRPRVDRAEEQGLVARDTVCDQPNGEPQDCHARRLTRRNRAGIRNTMRPRPAVSTDGASCKARRALSCWRRSFVRRPRTTAEMGLMSSDRTPDPVVVGLAAAFSCIWRWRWPPARELTPEEVDTYLERISQAVAKESRRTRSPPPTDFPPVARGW